MIHGISDTNQSHESLMHGISSIYIFFYLTHAWTPWALPWICPSFKVKENLKEYVFSCTFCRPKPRYTD